MKRGLIIAATAAALVGLLAAHAADGNLKELAARTELYPIQTLTLSDQHFLKGVAEGTATTISGQFRIAQGKGRLPVVVLMHGSGGMGPNIQMWSEELNAMGVSTFAIDGFTGRGLVRTSN